MPIRNGRVESAFVDQTYKRPKDVLAVTSQHLHFSTKAKLKKMGFSSPTIHLFPRDFCYGSFLTELNSGYCPSPAPSPPPSPPSTTSAASANSASSVSGSSTVAQGATSSGAKWRWLGSCCLVFRDFGGRKQWVFGMDFGVWLG